MSKKSDLRRPFKNKDGKRGKSLLKVEWQDLHQIYRSMRRQLIYKMSPLVMCKILRLFVNTLSADDKYSFLNRDNLGQPIQMQLSQKPKKKFLYFSTFSKSSLNFEHFQKKDDPHSWCISEGTDSKILCLDQCLKSLASAYPSKSNMVNASQHCWNLNDSTCTIFIDQCEGNWVVKSLC